MPSSIRCFQALALVSGLLLASACRSQKSRPTYSAVPCTESIAQGMRGQLDWVSGNQMPMISDKPLPPRQPQGVQRQVLVYPPQLMSKLSNNGDGFFSAPQEKPLLVLESSPQGCFQAQLPTGRYSLFVKEKGKLYANQFDGDGVIFPIEVKTGQVTPVAFPINYQAAY